MPIVVGPLAPDLLATPDDLEDRLGRAFTAEEALRAPSLLADVAATIRAVSGQWFTLGSSTARVRPRCGTVRLPQNPVNDVTAVETVDGDAVSYEWDGLGPIVEVWSSYEIGNRSWPRRREAPVDVTYEHGYNPIPEVIVALACQIALRCLGLRAGDGATDSETIGTYSYRLRDSAAAGTVGLLPAEYAAALAFRQPARPIRML